MVFTMFAPAMAFEMMDLHGDDNSVPEEEITAVDPSFPSIEKEVGSSQNETLRDPDDEPTVHGNWLLFGWIFFILGELFHRFLFLTFVSDDWTKEIINRTENFAGFIIIISLILVGVIVYLTSSGKDKVKKLTRQISAHYLAEDAE